MFSATIIAPPGECMPRLAPVRLADQIDQMNRPTERFGQHDGDGGQCRRTGRLTAFDFADRADAITGAIGQVLLRQSGLAAKRGDGVTVGQYVSARHSFSPWPVE